MFHWKGANSYYNRRGGLHRTTDMMKIILIEQALSP